MPKHVGVKSRTLPIRPFEAPEHPALSLDTSVEFGRVGQYFVGVGAPHCW